VALALALWAGLVLLFAIPFALIGQISWGYAVSSGALFWVVWLPLMPVLVWLSSAYAFERNRLARNLMVHVLSCGVAVTVSQLAFRYFIPMPPPPDEAVRQREPGVRTSDQNRRALGGFLGFRAGLDTLVYWSLVGACQAIANFRRSEQRERRAAELEARLTRSKLQALRMQINPHFLFNTLNAISTLIYVNPRAADDMLGDLSQLLRRSLDTMEEQEIPLARELQFACAYIGIEQKRFGDRLRLEQSVPEEIAKALVPALILQPLVENAIRHGIEPQRAPGLITIQGKRDGKDLHLIVRDNGKGPPPVGIGNSKSPGIGLSNTKARLRELYGPDHQFSFAKVEPRGCLVEIRIPFHTESVKVPPPSGEGAA
jgi:two-component sensor histidine kinase